jgi:hypothetical protein
MARTYDNEVFLFGAFFPSKLDGDETIFPEWHREGDLTQYTELEGKIRPIPLTPVMVNALSDSGGEPELWGSTLEGKLVHLGLGEPAVKTAEQPLAGEKVDTPDAPAVDCENYIVLQPGERPEHIVKGTDYESALILAMRSLPLSEVGYLLPLNNEYCTYHLNSRSRRLYPFYYFSERCDMCY